MELWVVYSIVYQRTWCFSMQQIGVHLLRKVALFSAQSKAAEMRPDLCFTRRVFGSLIARPCTCLLGHSTDAYLPSTLARAIWMQRIV